MKRRKRTVEINRKHDPDSNPFFGDPLSQSLLERAMPETRLALCAPDPRD